MAGPDDDPPEPPAGPAPADEPRADAPPADEPRARDIAAAKSTADLEQKLDPATVAQLAAWFGLPSFEQLEQQRAEQGRAEEEPNPFGVPKETREKIDAVADRALLDHLYGAPVRADAFRRFEHPPELHLRDRLLLLDESLADQFGTVGEPREYPQPDRVYDALRERAPQAILRDLHRPVLHYERYFEQIEVRPPLGSDLADVHALIATSLRIHPNEPTARTRVDEAFAWSKALRAQRWVDLPYKPPAPEPEGEPEPSGEKT